MLVAEHQVAGRGRLDRVWTSPPRAGLTVSFLLRPDVPAARRGWLPLLTGVALAEAVGEVTGVRTSLKWPNDLLAVDGRKLAGILAESTGTAVVVGVGLNVTTTARRAARHRDVAGPGARRDRRPRRRCCWPSSARVERRYRRWTEALGDPVSSGLAAGLPGLVARRSGTDGRGDACPTARRSRASREAVDWDGRLVVATAEGTVELATGDVRHVRATTIDPPDA